MQVVEYKGDTYPHFQTIGNASQFAIPFAKHVCSGYGYDVGCMKKEWAFPDSVPIDLSFDNGWEADNLPPIEPDYIFSSHCLEHVPDWVATMDYWYARLKLGGILFLYLPDYSQKYWRPWNNRRHKHCLKPEFIYDYMIDKGYKNVFVSGIDLNNAFMIMGRNEKIAVTTWVTDDYVDYIGLDELKNSFNHFHSDVDFFVFDTKATNEAMVKDPWLNNVWMMPPSCLPFVDDYDMVVHIDGDCVVTGPMTELFESDEDIIGVRNNNSLDKASSHPGITIMHLPPFGNGEYIPVQNFINAGLIASNNKQFWYDWHELNREAKRIKDEVNPYAHGIGDEQDTLNQIFHSGKYTTKIIDAMGTNVSYGLCNTWGENNNHWESWAQIYVKDDALYLDDPKTGDPMCIKVMHQAGGAAAAKLNKEHGGLREWMKTVIAEEPLQYIHKVTS